MGIKELRATYHIGRLLGNGSYGKVFYAVNKKNKDHKVAIKVIEKDGLDQEDLESLKTEVGILQKVDHPNIVKYYETYEDQYKIYLVMEFLDGGELLDTITKTQKNHEALVCEVMERVSRALIHIHSMNITHKDIKPDNIMFSSDGTTKLIDFGLSQVTRSKGEKMDTIAGTPYFIAPEVIKGNYSQECDIWSLGVVMYTCLTGNFPFAGYSREEVFAKIQAGQFDTGIKSLKSVSEECIDLMKKMITVPVKQRITPAQALKHPWFTKILKSEHEGAQIDQETIEKLKNFKGTSILKKGALNSLVKMLKPSEIQDLKSKFMVMDKDQSGFVDMWELQEVLAQSEHSLTAEQIKKIIEEVDYAKNQKINYSEFLAATIEVAKFLNEERLQALFSQFDVDESGYITKQNIKDAFSKLGRELNDIEINQIIKEHDIVGDQQLSFEEFKTLMTKDQK